MAHIHEIKDAEAHFIINATTREISNAAELPALVQHDHNSERFTFVVPRYVDGHDLSICNRVRVHYINIDSATKEQYADVYEVDDLHIDETDETKVVCTWLLSRYATQHAGSLNFIVEYACESNSVIDYAWHTAIFKGITVKASIHNAEQIMTEYTDILEKWKNDVLSGIELGSGSGGKGINNMYTSSQDIPFDGETSKVVIAVNYTDNTTEYLDFFVPHGKDYVLTEEDKAEIAEQAADLIDVPEKTSDFINDSGFITKNDVLSDKIEAVNTIDTISPNVYYSFGEVAELTLEFSEGVDEKVNEYMFSFISGETATVLTLPSSIQWANELTVEPNKRYEISVVDNIGLWCAVEVSE